MFLRDFNRNVTDYNRRGKKKRCHDRYDRVLTPSVIMSIIMAVGTIAVTLYTILCLCPMVEDIVGEFNKSFGATYFTKNTSPMNIVEEDGAAPICIETLFGYGDIWSDNINKYEEEQWYWYPDPKTDDPTHNIDGYFSVTKDERELMARIVYLEAGTSSDKTMRAVASVIFNRLGSGKMGKTIDGVIFYPGAFSTAKRAAKCVPSQRAYDAVDYVIMNGPTLPKYVRYFRDWYHHQWEGYAGYCVLDDIYFGYMKNWKNGQI